MTNEDESKVYTSQMVTLELDQTSKSRVYIHKALLISRAYLAEYFNKWASNTHQETILPITGWSMPVGSQVAHWLYTGKLSFNVNVHEDNIGDYDGLLNIFKKLAELYLGADRYKIDDLAAHTLDKLDAIFRSRGLSWWEAMGLLGETPLDGTGKLENLLIGVVADTIVRKGWEAYTADDPSFVPWLKKSAMSPPFVVDLMRRIANSKVSREAEAA
ncbi:hypothetical protein LTR10_014647 [Elasticomyces elasticus]|uniref:BTB domain-containing protein n=1 Tax=Exophiala sideris TaxID=1016849 RepID=A0ABR0JSN4_9EURO|nr:hypothetical protein LTR10_014647 [Elasticomyces elasticus]KAK5040625.1 hypothetical protein LTS07_001125 [Exophiala sideris]KAK5042951.1 hypothetical protein LTR13_000721 [Exophiala sideris]KAK5069003.1 hypothetical protein LTR69_001126 [Exophiala sideris]KAK5186600.1 hypothetical protein LTR44_001657 [Eurotiomycetes sp. CCFEE 6388]